MPTDLQALVGAPAWRWMGGVWWRVARSGPFAALAAAIIAAPGVDRG